MTYNLLNNKLNNLLNNNCGFIKNYKIITNFNHIYVKEYNFKNFSNNSLSNLAFNSLINDLCKHMIDKTIIFLLN